MRRRDFLGALAAGTTGAAISTSFDTASATTEWRSTTSSIDEVVFDSAASLLDADGQKLTDSSQVLVWAGDSATNSDADGNGDAVSYPKSDDIPMVGVDGTVFGFGGMFVTQRNYQYGNEEFYLNVWDEEIDGRTVVFDEGHDQYYDTSKYEGFIDYAEENGYTVSATTSIADDLAEADAAIVTSPGTSFTDSELTALQDFVDRGGVLFLHDQSDYNGYDSTAKLNQIASGLDLDFRFNDDQVLDALSNDGAKYTPVTDRFTAQADPYLEDREGMGLDPDKRYTVDVSEVLDGDTVKVEFDDGTTESIRILGVDTAEKEENQQHERPPEWEGIGSLDYLATWGSNATTFAKDRLSDETVELYFDGNESVRDPFGRVLGYIDYDQAGETRLYNRELITEGQARVYGSGLDKHDDFLSAEQEARAADRGVWAESEPENTPEFRNQDVSELFFPESASIKTTDGAVDAARVPVAARSSASQTIDDDGCSGSGGGGGDNESPIATFSVSGDSPSTGTEVTFDATESTDPDGVIERYEWSFGDGATATGAEVTHSFDDEEDYTVVLTVTDDEGATAETTQTVSVESSSDDDCWFFFCWFDDDSGSIFDTAAGSAFEGGSVAPSSGPPDPIAECDVTYDSDIPLVAVDEDASVGMVGAPIVDESYEKEEGFGVSTASYGNYTFLTNLIDYLADGEGDVLIDGGHGQFNADFALSNEDAAYYQKHLEGLGIEFDQYNDITRSKLDGYRAVIVTAPPESFSNSEASALADFASDGGAVVLMGAGTASELARRNLNALAADLDTDLRLNDDQITDESNNLDDNDEILTTDNLDDSFPLFSKFTAGGGGGGGGGGENEKTYTGSLSGDGDDAVHAYATQTDSPSEVTFSLSAGSRTDYDLYVTDDGRDPTTSDYDHRSFEIGSDETITVSDVSAGQEFGILVDSYSGSGEYTLTVEEQ